MEYVLPETELSPYCRGRYNPQIGKFEDISTIDTIKCCLSSCSDHIIFCYDTCDKNYGNNYWEKKRCYRKCAELINDCESNCMEIPSRGLSVVSGCAKKCGTYPVFNSECLQNEKQAIIDCCNEQSPNQSCDELYGYLSGGMQFPLAKLARKVGEDERNVKGRNVSVFGGIVLGITLFVMALLLALVGVVRN